MGDDYRKSVMVNQPTKSPQTKAVEWGIVGRTVGVAKTSMLQKMGKAEVTQSDPLLVVNNLKTKALKVLYDETIRMSRKLVKKMESFNKATESLRVSLVSVTGFYTTECPTGQSLEKISVLHNEFAQLRTKFDGSVNNRFILPAEAFLTTTIVPARDAKDKFRKARLEYDSALSKLKIQQQAKDFDAKGSFLAHSHHAIYKAKYQHRQYDAGTKLQDTVTRHGFEYLVESINLLAAQHDYFSSACQLLKESEEFVNEMREAAAKHRDQYQTNKQTELERLMQEAAVKEENKYNELVEIFSAPDLAVVNAICLSAGSDQDAILEDLVRILDAHKQTLPIIKLGITKEVESTNSAATLFRGNSTATKLMTAFTRMTGREYLIETLKPLIDRIVKDPSGYELDPDKSQNTAGNSERLTHICQEFLDSIYKSISSCPLPFREMANHLQNEVVKRFPESKHISVGGFIFLRFFCPCILSPDASGVVEMSALSVEARRSLILVSKVLQNLANGILFGAKEPFMKDMNTYLEKNMEGCKAFLDNVATLPGISDYKPLSSVQDVKNNQLPSIHKLLIKNLEKIFKTLTQYNQQSVTFQLVSSLGRLGEPKD